MKRVPGPAQTDAPNTVVPARHAERVRARDKRQKAANRTDMTARSRAAASIAHERISNPSIDDHLAVLARAVFQAGLSWAAIDRQWPALVEAFEDFMVSKVARFGDRDVRRILERPGIVHSERKTRAVIGHARTLAALRREFGGIQPYLRSHGSYGALVTDLRRRFPYVGEVSAYYYLWRVGENVPPFARWIATVDGEHPRIREMVGRRPARPR